jgi:hypothetical protein
MKTFLQFLLCVLAISSVGCAVEYTQQHDMLTDQVYHSPSSHKVEHDKRTRTTPDTH